MRISAPTYTQAPNDLFDKWLPLLKEVELKVLLVIMRKTLGWHKIRDRISISQLQKLTGSTPSNIKTATDGLIEKGLISKEVIGETGKQQTFYELVIHEDSNNSYPSQIDRGTPPNSRGETPPNLGVTKETLSKENLKKSDLIEPQGGNLKILDFNGKEQTLTKQDLFSLAVTQNTDWTAQEIELLHERLEKHKGNVRELASFCKAIIKKERTINNINKHTGEIPCRQSKEFTQKNNSMQTEKKTQELSEKKESQITNSEVLEKDIGMRLFANWRETHKLRQPLTSG